MEPKGGAIDPSGHEGPPAVNAEQEATELERALRRRLTRTCEGADDRESATDLTQLQCYSSFLKKLLEFIAKEDDQSISRVVSVIRSGASYTEIQSAIEQLSQGSKGAEHSDEKEAAPGGLNESAKF